MSGRSVAVALGYKRVDDRGFGVDQIEAALGAVRRGNEPGRPGHGDQILGTGLAADEADVSHGIAAGGPRDGHAESQSRRR